jgi:hypothetical protein
VSEIRCGDGGDAVAVEKMVCATARQAVMNNIIGFFYISTKKKSSKMKKYPNKEEKISFTRCVKR